MAIRGAVGLQSLSSPVVEEAATHPVARARLLECTTEANRSTPATSLIHFNTERVRERAHIRAPRAD